MTSCHVQSNYGSTVTLYGGPVVLRPVMATPGLFRYISVLAETHRQSIQLHDYNDCSLTYQLD